MVSHLPFFLPQPFALISGAPLADDDRRAFGSLQTQQVAALPQLAEIELDLGAAVACLGCAGLRRGRRASAPARFESEGEALASLSGDLWLFSSLYGAGTWRRGRGATVPWLLLDPGSVSPGAVGAVCSRVRAPGSAFFAALPSLLFVRLCPVGLSLLITVTPCARR